MRIALATVGTLGDVAPFVAIAAGAVRIPTEGPWET